MRKISTLLTMPLTLCATLATVSAAAEDTANLGKMVVTATKKSITVTDAPASVSVVTAEEIEEKNIQRVDEALKTLPSVYVRSTGDHRPSAWANTVTMRGIAGYDRVGVLVDGQSINNAFSGGANWSSIATEEIQSIEVVPGPFSSLYGGSAMAGVINIISKTPEKREATIKAGYGDNDLANMSVYYRDKLTDKLGISANLGYKESDGYAADIVTKSVSAGAGTIPVSGATRTTDKYGNTVYILGDKGGRSWWQQNVGVKLFYDLDNSSKVYFGIADHEHETSFESFNTYLRDAAGNPVYSGDVDITADGVHKSITEKDFLFGPNGETATRYSMGYERTLTNDANLKLDAYYSDNNYWYVSQLTGATSSSGSGKFADIPNSKSNVSLQYTLPLNDTHYLTMGASMGGEDLDKREYTLSNWTNRDTSTMLRYQGRGENQSYALYMQDEIAVASNVTLYVGGRYDYWETSGEVHQYTAPVYDATYSSRDKDTFSPKISVVYEPAARTVLRASAGRAFHAPSLSDMYSTWVASSGKVNESNPDLKPELVTSWEIGAEKGLWKGASVKATYYESYLTDLIYQTDVTSMLSVKRNAGKAETKGVELEFRQMIGSGVEMFANATYNDATITENSAEPASVGKAVTYIPEQQYNLGLNGRRGPWHGSAVLRYVGDVFTHVENTDTIDSVPGSYESYYVVDTKLGYKITDQLTASISIENLLDREYYQSSLAPGRTIYGEVAYRF